MTDESIFTAAVAIADSGERQAYLDRACGGNATLRREVDELLAAHDGAKSFLQDPAVTAAYPQVPMIATPPVVGRYKLLEKIGEGGMGEVWVAEQLEPIRRRVALKVIKPGMDSRVVLARFDAERQALALMDHPNIARVLDAGTTQDGRPYFVMELVKGTPITKFCDARKLSPRERLELFVAVCQAIQHAHQKGIIHRDIKPSNVLVALHDEKPIPKVIDFGVAKAIGQQLTERTLYTNFGALVGTPAYMAPEQATFNQLDVDTRADVYALGVLLYELLAGSPPFEHERLQKAGLEEVLRLVREEEPPRPSDRLSTSQAKASIAAVRQSDPEKLAKLVRGELDWIVMKALEKDRTRRYESANGLGVDVLRYLAGDAVTAVPPSVGYRLRKFVRRNRGPVTAAALVLFVLLAGIVGTTLGLIRADRSRDDAVAAQAAEVKQRKVAEAREKDAVDAGVQLRNAKDELAVSLYAARANLIQSAWEAHGVARMRELLEEQKPKVGERDLRGFEWHHWDRIAHSELTTSPPVSEYERARVGMARRLLSPDGRKIAILWGSAANCQIEIRDALSGTKLTRFDLIRPKTPPDRVVSSPWLAFTSDSEGLFVSARPEAGDGEHYRLRWWLFDAATGKELVPSHEVPCEGAYPSMLGPDRIHFAVPARVDGPKKAFQIKLWELAGGNEARTFAGTFAEVYRTSFRPDGKEIAAVVSTSSIPAQTLLKVWETATGRERLSILIDRLDYVRGLTWSPNGRRLAAWTTDLQIWDAANGMEVLRLTGEEGWIEKMVFSHDGAQIACVEPAARFVLLRDATAGRIQKTFKIAEENTREVAFTADGARLVTISGFGTVRSWNARASDLPVAMELPMRYAMSTSVFQSVGDLEERSQRPGGSHAIAADASRIAIVDTSNKYVTSWWERLLSPAQAFLLVGDQSGKLVLNLTRPSQSYPNFRAYGFESVALSPDGKLVAWLYVTRWVQGIDKKAVAAYRLVMLDVDSQRELWFEDLPAYADLQTSPDGRWLAVRTRGELTDLSKPATGKVRILEVESGREVYSFPAFCSTLHFSRDGNLLVGMGTPSNPARERSYPLKVWDLRTGREIRAGNYPTDLFETVGMKFAALSPDGSRLAVSWINREKAEGIVRLFEVPSGRELSPLKGHDDTIGLVAFNHDGTRLAAAGRTVKIWDTASGQELLTLRDPKGGMLSLQFSPDGHKLHAVMFVYMQHALKTWDATPRGDK